ncbi:MAG: peptidylprolyl isomerase [Enterobacterales bacterium]|nr:peptidylprolyl isomerase [Enterobacterales bacterium]
MSKSKSNVLLILVLLSSQLFAEQQSQNNLAALQSLKASIWQKVDQRQLDHKLFQSALSQSDSQLQEIALQGLGRIGGAEILPLVKPFLVNPNPKLRQMSAFALGISLQPEVAEALWQALATEKNSMVKQELYLAIGNLGGKNLAQRMVKPFFKETDPLVQAKMLNALSIAITMHKNVRSDMNMKNKQKDIVFADLLKLMEKDDALTYHIAYFLARIKGIQSQISPAQLQRFTYLIKTTNNKKMIARLVGKVTKRKHLANRRLLSWLIEQSESKDVPLACEAIKAMSSLLYIPQAKIQLGKLHISTSPVIAQTALETLAQSPLGGSKIMKLLKKQLKSKRPGMVVEAMAGLIKRQDREDMSWAVKIMAHPDPYVKLHFIQLVADKDFEGFKNVISNLSHDKDPRVSHFAKRLLEKKQNNKPSSFDNTSIDQALASRGKKILFHTHAGDFIMQMNDQAIYTTANFIRLVKKGFYNHSYFIRVIGNFVAQGGDPIGDGNGSSGELIREEISYLSHLTGTVGMATSGKDTGDSQFFININDNTHLDRRYTVFAKVIEGMDVVYQLANGDQIISAKIVE